MTDPTDAEIMELMPQEMRDDLAAAARAMTGPELLKASAVCRIILNRHAVDHARAVLDKWGNSQGILDSSPQPVAVSERLPKPEDCNGDDPMTPKPNQRQTCPKLDTTMTDSTPTTAKKLYAVRVEYQAYVLAESEADAEDFAREITDTEDNPEIFVTEANGGNELGWSGDCCIYHSGPGDIRLREALAITDKPDARQ